MGAPAKINKNRLKQGLHNTSIEYKNNIELCRHIKNTYQISVIIIAKTGNTIKITPTASIDTGIWTHYMFLYCDHDQQSEQYKLIDFNGVSLFEIDQTEPPDFIILFIYLWWVRNSSVYTPNNILFYDKFANIRSKTGVDTANIQKYFTVPTIHSQHYPYGLRNQPTSKKAWVLNININIDLYPGEKIPIAKRPVLSCNEKSDNISKLLHEVLGKDAKSYSRSTINPQNIKPIISTNKGTRRLVRGRYGNVYGNNYNNRYGSSSSDYNSIYGSSNSSDYNNSDNTITKNWMQRQRNNNNTNMFGGGKKTRKNNKTRKSKHKIKNKTKNLRRKKSFH